MGAFYRRFRQQFRALQPAALYPDVRDPIKFLRQREIVHFQRFGEALRSVQEQLDEKNFYAFNPSFDCPCEASCKNS